MTFERPRRLTPPEPPGSMLKRFSDQPQRRALRAEQAEEKDYLALVRRLPCLYCGVEASEAAHVRFASAAFGKASGLQKKPLDKFAVPLCAEDHRLARHAQHNRNEEAFWIGIGINPLLVAERLWAQRHDFVAMYHVAVQAIAYRSKT